MQQPSIYPFGVEITEPVIALTDLIVSAVAFYCWWRCRGIQSSGLFFKYMTYYFLFMSISTFMGAWLAHAFLHIYGQVQKVPGWQMGMIAIAFLELASIAQVRDKLSEGLVRGLWFFIGLKLVAAMLMSISTQHFLYVGIHSAVGILLIVLPLHWYGLKQTRSKGHVFFLRSIMWVFVTAIIFAGKLSIHPYFTDQDISHLIMAYCVFLFYRGTRLLNLEGMRLSTVKNN